MTHTKESLMALADRHAAEVSVKHPSLPKSRNALEDALDEVMRDAARLDHLAKSVRCMGAYVGGNHSWSFLFGKGWKQGANFREAVDNDMKESK
jgi:hypothetical protein